jgi:hypothetical protein
MFPRPRWFRRSRSFPPWQSFPRLRSFRRLRSLRHYRCRHRSRSSRRYPIRRRRSRLHSQSRLPNHSHRQEWTNRRRLRSERADRKTGEQRVSRFLVLCGRRVRSPSRDCRAQTTGDCPAGATTRTEFRLPDTGPEPRDDTLVAPGLVAATRACPRPGWAIASVKVAVVRVCTLRNLCRAQKGFRRWKPSGLCLRP